LTERKGSDLLVRLASVAVILPVVLVLLWVGGWWFAGLVAVLIGIATWEYVRLLHRLGYRPVSPFAILIVYSVLFSAQAGDANLLQPLLAVVCVASLAWHVLADRTKTQIENWLLPLGGALYIGWTSGHMLLLRALSNGAYRLFATFGIIWIADSVAYICGKLWGRHRLAPRLSPKKTWEGYAGGILGGILGGALLMGLGGLGWGHGAILGLLEATIAPIGDLGISLIKRQVGVKDTGTLIPGHGGALDRVDATLVASVLGYYYHLWIMGAGPG
jgi:phosphatidate cytidylyltransferase